jgi:hypothetical protein
LKNIAVIYVKKEKVQDTKLRLKERFDLAKRIVGTRSFHSFVPKDLKHIYVSITSSGQKFEDVRKVSY